MEQQDLHYSTKAEQAELLQKVSTYLDSISHDFPTTFSFPPASCRLNTHPIVYSVLIYRVLFRYYAPNFCSILCDEVRAKGGSYFCRATRSLIRHVYIHDNNNIHHNMRKCFLFCERVRVCGKCPVCAGLLANVQLMFVSGIIIL